MKGEIISSINNPMVKEARSLNDKKFRRFYGKYLVDGEKLVNEVVLGDFVIDKIFVDSTRLHDFGYILENYDGTVVPVTPKVFSSISENVSPQGIMAEVEMKVTGEFRPNQSKPFLVLDRIQDPGNMGTIIRTAAATGIESIVLIDCTDAFSPKVVRSSSGGVFYVDIYKMTEKEVMSFAQSSGIKLLVADMAGENIFTTQNLPDYYALVIGNEGQGVSQNFKQTGRLISLPMKSQMESLNAGVSASVLMYTLLGKNI